MLITANSPALHGWAMVTSGLWGAVFLHIGISFPDGRVAPGLDRALVVAGYFIFPLSFLPGRGAGAVLYGALFAVVLFRSQRHWRAADDFERLQLTPVYTFALLTFLLVTIAQAGDSDVA